MLLFEDVVEGSLFDEPFRWRMGVRSLPAPRWLQIDDGFDADLAEKARVLRDHRGDALAAQPEASAACAALTGLIGEELAVHGRSLVPEQGAPLERAARSVQEDFCVLERRREGWVLTAGAVCFPTRWSMADKLGGTLREIHGPVPDYEVSLGARVDRFFDRMPPRGLAWRLNWSIVDRPDRRLPVGELQAPMSLPADPGRGLFLRVERQTLRRLESAPVVAFGIRIHVWPLEDVLLALPASELAAALASMSAPIAAYKDLAGVRGPLIEWLQRTW